MKSNGKIQLIKYYILCVLQMSVSALALVGVHTLFEGNKLDEKIIVDWTFVPDQLSNSTDIGCLKENNFMAIICFGKRFGCFCYACPVTVICI